jgi:predicted ArsR family transcriptional regulator
MTTTPLIDIVRYLVDHGEQQTFRIGRHIGCNTDETRRKLRLLERRGMVSPKRMWNGPLFWSATPQGRTMVAHLNP